MEGKPEGKAVPRRRQWHWVFYGLALFNVLVVGLGLLLDHLLFREQADHAETLRDFEFLIAGFVIVMISMATGYGHRIKKELERRDAERARYIAELEKSHQRLAHANDSLIEEVQARSQAEATLRLSEERYALAARGANDGLWDWDLQVDEVYYSPRWKMLLGYADDELGRRPGEWLERVHPDDQDELRSRLQAAMESGEPFEIEHRVRHRDRGYRWMLARGVATAGGASRRLVGSHSDVTARKEAELALVHDSLHDGLTGLPNRVLFLDRLDHALQRGRRPGSAPLAAIYLDLDRFKQVNDTLGHLAGDELLIKFAELLRRVIRPGDTAARLGGDEFAILLENVHSEAGALTVAQRILTELEQPIQIDGAVVHTSASIGVAMGRPDYASAAEVLRDADAALYRAKRDGRGRLQVFEPKRFERVFDSPRLEIDLRGAIAHNELHLLYQPIVKLGTGDIIGVEALVRWTHPRLGAVPPSTFVPIAEESGDITAIGSWVLQEACLSVASLSPSAAGDPLFVSVNISPHQLSRDDFVTGVLATLSETGLDPDRLCLEITENSVVRDRAHATLMLQQLRERGVQICIDDFGAGHSALSYVDDLPVDGIKIDRSIISRLTSNDDGDYTISVILDLASRTGLTAVAEGVETELQKTALVQLGCEYAQGYLFDGPLSLRALVERLESFRKRVS